MTGNEKFAASGAIIGAVILFWLLSKSQPGFAGEIPPVEPPTYTNYNAPGVNLPDINVPRLTLPPIPNAGCGCIPSTQFFTGLDQFATFLTSNLENVANTFFNNIISALPQTISQYVNDFTAFQKALISNAALNNFSAAPQTFSQFFGTTGHIFYNTPPVVYIMPEGVIG